MDTCIIVNPAAGKGEGARTLPKIKALLQAHGINADVVLTERPRHAEELALAAARNGAETVVAVGGDGTVNEVINGLMQIPEAERSCAMGVLGVGRGNDFAFGTNIPHDLEEGVRVLAEGHRHTIDVGHVAGGDYPQGRYFGNGIGIGFDAVVGFVAAKQRVFRGFAGYISATLKTVFLYYPAPTVNITVGNGAPERQETTSLPALMISVMNGRRMGGGFLMAPDGEPSDGLLDICVAQQVNRLGVFQLVPHFMKGTQATQDAITTTRTDHVIVSAVNGDTLPAHADGETLCTAGHRLEMCVIPEQLQVICRKPTDPGTAKD